MCTKVKDLKRLGYKNFEEWYSTQGNLYVGKGGSIGGFKFRSSKFANPFHDPSTIFDPSRYQEHILFKLKKGDITIADIFDVYNAKVVGCFCEDVSCHTPTLIDIVTSIVECRKKLDV